MLLLLRLILPVLLRLAGGHGTVLRLLGLKHSGDLRQDRQDLADHFVDVLRRQLALLAKGRLGLELGLLSLGQNVRQDRHQLAHHLADFLLAQLTLLPKILLRPTAIGLLADARLLGIELLLRIKLLLRIELLGISLAKGSLAKPLIALTLVELGLLAGLLLRVGPGLEGIGLLFGVTHDEALLYHQ